MKALNQSNLIALLFLSAVTLNGADSQNKASPGFTPTPTMDGTPSTPVPVVMPTIEVVGKAPPPLEAASAGTVTGEELQQRPTQRVGDLLETVPGLIVTQHAGGGKANQYFLRGFNLDHGTDLYTTVDGVPVNMGTHAHGQGYDDINFVIPELVQSIDFRKGPYYADVGDFGNAGDIAINYVRSLPSNMVVLETGAFDYERALYAGSRKIGPGDLLYGLEVSHDGGPWKSSDDYRKINGLIKYSQGDENEGFSISAQAYNGQWNASDEYPQSLHQSGQISRFQGLDPTDGGGSSRDSIYGEWHQRDAESSTDITVFGVHYYMNIYSDFTFFLNDPVNGDQFRQYDSRYIAGTYVKHSWNGKLGEMDMTNTVGLQVRNDMINLALDNTEARQVLNQVRADSVLVSNISPYYDNKIQWTDWLATDVGLRGDLFYYDDKSDNPLNSGHSLDLQPSPKFSITLGPWDKTEVYINTGEGLRSNDARGILSTVDPNTGASVIGDKPIVQTQGAEIGVRTKYFSQWESDLSFWVLHSQSELFFDGDVGANDDSDRPGFRYGVEWSNKFFPVAWLTIEDTVAFSRSQFTDNNQTAGLYIPEAIQSMGSAGFTIHDLSFASGFTYSMDMRYMGPRALVEDNSERSEQVLVFNARVAYDVNENVSLFLDFLNLTNSHYYDAEYSYQSAYPRGAAPVNDFQVHPGEPFNMRGGVILRF